MDLSKLSDEELRRMAGRQETAQRSVRDLSDDELRALAQPSAEQPAPDAPWYAKLGGAADDIVRLAANAVTLGGADRFAGYMSGSGQKAEEAKTKEASDRAGWAGTVAEIGGAMLPAGAAVGLGGAAARYAAPSIAANANLALRTAGLAGVGAGLGAAEAGIKGNDVGMGALIGGAAGGVGSLAGEAISKGIGKVAGAFNKQPKVPTIDELNAAKNAAYQAADNAGVIFTPNAVNRVKGDIVSSLTKIGYDPALQPGAAPVVRRLLDLDGQNVTFTGLDTLRKVANNGYIPGNKSNNAAVSSIVRAIDDMTTNPRAADVLTGDATTAGKIIKNARDLAARSAKAEQVEYAVKSAANRAASTGSGGNADNATRQNIRKMLERGRGFTADEKAAMQQVIEGTTGQNALRLAGKLSPQGNGLMLALQAGAAGASGGMTVPLAVAGGAAKWAADRGTRTSVDELSRIIRAGGSRAATQAPPNAVQRLAQSEKDRLMRLIMSGGLVSAN
jgi:hypothetical protein